MNISSVRRARGAGVALCLAAAGLILVPNASHAGVLDTPQAQAGINFSGSGSCTESGPGDATSALVPFAPDGIPVTTTVSSSATYTHNVDNTDVTTMSASVSSTVKATQAGGALKTLAVDSLAQLSLQATKGTAQACGASVNAQAVDVASFDLPSAKYVRVTIKSKSMVGGVILQNTAGLIGGASQNVNYFLHSNLSQTLYLNAGTWIIQVQQQSVIQAPTPTQTMPSPVNAKIDLDMIFDDPGVATGAAQGDADKYLDLAAGRTCGTGSLSATWKSKAGKGDKRTVKKAVFRVDGAKVKTVKKPTKKQVTTLTGLDPDEMADVSVTLKLVKKGAGKPTVERTYLACT
jgi:hypothetical protein